MFDHVGLRVPNLAAAQRVLERLLTTLDIEQTRDSPSLAAWNEFLLAEANEDRPVTRRAHVAFVAPSPDSVEGFRQAAVEAGLRDDGPSLRDPEGNSFEAVHRDAERPGGAIDHLVIAVADLVAATAFYRTAAAAAGYDVRSEGPEGTTFAGASGAAFSLVPGPPTENLHVAFPGDDEAVRRFHDEGIAAGYRDNGEPGERPQYHPGYYASFVLDPDGNNIEVVSHHRS